jgi:hypothetical protein
MAVVAVTSKNALAPVTPASILLAVSGDTLVYTADQGQELILCNTSASPVVVTIDGSAGTTITVPDTAGATLSVASGLAVTVAANSFAMVALDKAKAYLNGTVAITAATGAVVRAAIVTPY